jgi:hypothetical protein
MTHEATTALENIVSLCERSENLTGRQIRIFEIALTGLGLVKRQRDDILSKWRQRIIQDRRDRVARRELDQQVQVAFREQNY